MSNNLDQRWERYFVENDVQGVESGPRLREGARPAPSWTVPSDADGADDYDGCVDAFCRAAGLDASVLPDKTRRQWSRVLRKIAERNGAGPSALVAAIDGKNQSTIDWKAWPSPHQAERDVEFLLLQAKSGGVEPGRQTRQQRNAAILAEWSDGD